jgi:polyisoprenoid-binding protein YceI
MSLSATTIPGYVVGTWSIDPVHSEIGFSVRHMMVSKVRGKFTKFSGEIVTAEEPRSTSISVDGDDFVLNGELSLKGRTKSVPLALEFGGISPDPYGGIRMGFSATGEISRSEFGVDFNAALETGGVVVADKVSIALEIEAVLNQ